MDTDAVARLVSRYAAPTGPGLAVGVYRGGVLVSQFTAGLASVEFGVPIDEHTRFDIASMSKQFAATAVLLLARDGLVSLDDDIRTHLPELRLETPVTIAQCLQHTGGLREWLALAAVAGRSLTRITQDQTLEFVSGLSTLDFPPGAAFRYSNTGYVLAASLVHRVTGRTLGEFAAERIFRPLGMHRTLFREDSRAVLPGFAYGYESIDDRVLRADSEECAVGDGGLVTSLSELGPWFRFLRDGDVLGEDIRDTLVDSAPVFPDGSAGPYAYGIYHADLGGESTIGHAGAVAGYRSHLCYLPDHDLGVVVLANHSAVRATVIANAVARLAVSVPEAPVPAPAHDTESARAAAGWWIMPGADESMRTEARLDGTLTLSGFQSGRFTLAEDGCWYGEDRDEGLQLLIDGDRLVLRVHMRPGRDLTFERCAAPDASTPPPAGTYLSPELGTLVLIEPDGRFRLGLDIAGEVEAGPDGTFLVGPASVRRDGDDLRLGIFGVDGLRFVRQPEGTALVGVPRGLDTAS
ncbi:serine hydrolase domain-containing protein [Microbacterium sp. LBN7]|uniref:serine hydrolase domain-containing protein n=1 Tax=Microbacterium sp. LBN7 TaxID=3129773 RepID=UPI00324ECCA6